MNNLKLFFWFVPAAFIFATCSSDEERKEQIGKLRALGVEQSPVVATPGQPVTLTFHLASPQAMTLSAASYRDTAARYGSVTDVTLIDQTPVSQDLGALTHYTLRAQFNAPNDAATTATIARAGQARVRYGLRVVDVSGDEETIVGDTLVYAADAPQQSWSSPTISIDQPIDATIPSATALSATIQSAQGESNLVSWFVSSGKVKNPNARSSEWQEIGLGEQTLILTVRGRKSGSFAIKTATVTVR